MGEPQTSATQGTPQGRADHGDQAAAQQQGAASAQTPPQASQPSQPSPGAPGTGANAGGFVIPLRNGASCVYTASGITIAGVSYPFSDLVFAGLVDDITLPRPPGAPPIPGVTLRTASGQAGGMTPIDPMDCWRLLTAIYTVRPDLNMPLPPPPVYAYPGFPPPQQTSQNNETVLAGIAHLSIFFAPLITPLIIWLVTANTMPYASRQGKQAFVFHVVVTAVEFVAVFVLFIGFFLTMAATISSSTSNPAAPSSGFFFFPFLIWLLILPISIISIVLGIYAAIQTFQGKPYHYPLLGWL